MISWAIGISLSWETYQIRKKLNEFWFFHEGKFYLKCLCEPLDQKACYSQPWARFKISKLVKSLLIISKNFLNLCLSKSISKRKYAWKFYD